MKSIVCFLVGWLLWSEAISQPLNWINKAEGNGEENITAQCFLPDNYFVIAGIFEKKHGINLQSANGKQFRIRTEYTKINEQVFLNNFFLAKYNDRGNLIWALNSTGYNNAYPYDVCSDTKGNIIVCGSFQGDLKLSSADGNNKVLEGSKERAFCCTNDTMFLRYNYFIAKYNNEGNLLWCKSAHAMDNAFAEQVMSDGSDNIYVKAYCATNAIAFNRFAIVGNALGATNYGMIFIKYAPQGEEQWASYAGNLDVKNMKLSADGEISFLATRNNKATIWNTAGKAYKVLGEYSDQSEIILDNQGNVKAYKPVFPTIENLAIVKYARDKSGNYYVIAQKEHDYYNPNNNLFSKIGQDVVHPKEHDFLLIKTSPEGKVIWHATIAGSEMRKAFDIIIDAEQNLVITGSSYSGQITIEDAKKSITILPEERKPLTWYKLFMMHFSSEGRFIHSNYIADIGPPAFVEKTELCRLSENDRGDLLISASVSLPSEISGQKINVLGPIGYFPYYDTINGTYGVYKYSDAYFGIIKSGSSSTIDSNLITQIAKADTLYSAYEPIKHNIELPVEKDLSIMLFPNPVIDNNKKINIVINSTTQEPITLQILDQTGKIIFSRQENLVIGKNITSIFMTLYPAAVYYIRFVFKNKMETKKVILQ